MGLLAKEQVSYASPAAFNQDPCVYGAEDGGEVEEEPSRSTGLVVGEEIEKRDCDDQVVVYHGIAGVVGAQGSAVWEMAILFDCRETVKCTIDQHDAPEQDEAQGTQCQQLRRRRGGCHFR